MSDISQDFRLADILGAPQDIKAASEPDIGHISEILNDYAGQFLEIITRKLSRLISLDRNGKSLLSNMNYKYF